MLAQTHAAVSDPNLKFALRVLPALITVLVAAAVCGKVALLLGQPRVVGEMVAGVLLGPTLFGALWPSAQAEVFPRDVRPILYVLSTLGLTLYMFLVGAGLEGETRVRGEIRRAVVLAVSGIVPALLIGGGVGLLLWSGFSLPGVGRWEFALFVGGALSLTAFPMLARILYERGLENSALGRLSLLAASVDDAAVWCLLAILTAIHLSSGPGAALRTIGLAAAFIAVMLLVVARPLRLLGRPGALDGAAAMYLVILVPLVAGWITDWIGVYSVFGGFVAGLAMPRDPEFRRILHERMMEVVSTLLLPVFFAFSGLNTRLDGITGGSALVAFLVILAVGFGAKYLGCALSMQVMGFSRRESFAVGALMNARGLMILIFINIGLAQGMISQQLFSMFVLVAVLTTASALPLYRLALPQRHERAAVSIRDYPAEQAA